MRSRASIQMNHIQANIKRSYLNILLAALVTAQIIRFQSSQLSVWLVLVFLTSCAWQVRFTPLHPVVWLCPFLFLYHFSIIILWHWGIRPVVSPEELILVGWLATATSAIVLLILCDMSPSNGENCRKTKIHFSKSLTSLGHLTLLIAAVLDNSRFIGLGIQNKAELNVLGIEGNLFLYGFLMVTYSVLFAEYAKTKKKFPFWLFLATGLICLFSTLNLGERDIFLRFSQVTIFLTVALFCIPRRYILASAIVILVSIPVLGAAKNMFARNTTVSSIVSRSIDEPLISVLNGEFMSAGRNVDTILSNRMNWDYFYGQTLLWDIPRSIIPARFYHSQNGLGWFADLFHAKRLRLGQGVGFSLAAEGFINFGYTGVLLFFVLFAGLLSFLYNRSSYSSVNLLIYVLSAGFFIYAIRGDFSTLLSPLLKQVFIPLFALAGISGLLRRRWQTAKHVCPPVMGQTTL